MNAEKDKLEPATPAKPTTPGYANDPRWTAEENLVEDNDKKRDRQDADTESKKNAP